MPRHSSSSIALIASLSLCSIPALEAPRGPLALGLILGDPNGINIDYHLHETRALEASLRLEGDSIFRG